ncbi:alkaline phosphatase family protein [Shewanella surugensis]|uniref:Alkaline phosphatase family protein n=1 Tax=Shewanella surugensis TaxID=212020 RepID=A0ABT0L9A3_9GAMM|nr:alkaline phosphatase family protein [Shewanella surugensis]MCL1124293.1 alkaline phosphatase family protein [Shewanella surugensis]
MLFFAYKRMIILLLLIILVSGCNDNAATTEPPRLIVLVTLDQGRFDYPLAAIDSPSTENSQSGYTGYGLAEKEPNSAYAKFKKQGFVADFALIEHSSTLTPQGHHTINTGGNPWSHGFPSIDYTRYDINAAKQYECADNRYSTLGLTQTSNNIANAYMGCQSSYTMVCPFTKEYITDDTHQVVEAPPCSFPTSVVNEKGQVVDKSYYFSYLNGGTTALAQAPITLGDAIYKTYNQDNSDPHANKKNNGKVKVFGIGSWDEPGITMMGRSGRFLSVNTLNGQYTSSNYFYPQGLPTWLNTFNQKNDLIGYYQKLAQDPKEPMLALSSDNSGFDWIIPNTLESYQNAEFQQDDRHLAWMEPPVAINDQGQTITQNPNYPHHFSNQSLSELTQQAYFAPFSEGRNFELAKELIIQEDLGQDAAPDLLILNLSALDMVGHMYGPDSIEHEQTLGFINRRFGEFLDFIQKRLGKDNVLVIFTADHGMDSVPEFLNNAAGVNYQNQKRFTQQAQFYTQADTALDPAAISKLNQQANRLCLVKNAGLGECQQEINPDQVYLLETINQAISTLLNRSDRYVAEITNPGIFLNRQQIVSALPNGGYPQTLAGYQTFINDLITQLKVQAQKQQPQSVDSYYSTFTLRNTPLASLDYKKDALLRKAILSTDRNNTNSALVTTDAGNSFSITTGRSGDITVVPTSHSYFYQGEKDAAMHGTPEWYDSAIQLMFWGNKVTQQRLPLLTQPMRERSIVRQRDITPTIAAILNIPIQHYPLPGKNQNNQIYGKPINDIMVMYNKISPYQSVPELQANDKYMENTPLEYLGPPTKKTSNWIPASNTQVTH